MNLQNGSTKTSKGKRQQKVPLKQLHLRTERGRAGGEGVPGELNWSAALCGRRDKATLRNWVDQSPPTYTHYTHTDSRDRQRLSAA